MQPIAAEIILDLELLVERQDKTAACPCPSGSRARDCGTIWPADVAIGKALDAGPVGAVRQLLDGEFIFVAADEIDRRAASMLLLRLDRDLGADEADLGGGIEERGSCPPCGMSDLKLGRRGMDNDQLMRLHVFLDVLEGEPVRRRVDQAANPAPSPRPGPARWETRSSSLRVSSDSARRRRHHSRRRKEPGGKAISWAWNSSLQDWDKVQYTALVSTWEAAATPIDCFAEAGHHENGETQALAHGQEPERTRMRGKNIINAALEEQPGGQG